MSKVLTERGRFLQATAHEVCTALAFLDAIDRDAMLERFARENGLASNDVLTCVVFEKALRIESLATMAGGLPSLEEVRRGSAEIKWAILAGCVRLLNAGAEDDLERRVRPS